MKFKTLCSRTTLSNNQLNQVYLNGLTSDDTLAICGLHPWRNILTVWGEKTGEIEIKVNYLTKSQYDLEISKYIAALFTLESGKRTRRCNVILQHNDYPWMLANINRTVVGEDAFLEYHVVNNGPYEDEISLWKLLKLQHKMAVSGATHCYLAVLENGRSLKIKKVLRSNKLIKSLIEKSKNFWSLVQTKNLPEPNGSQATTKAINKLFPLAKEYEKINLPNCYHILKYYDKLMKKNNEINKEIETVKQKLKLLMGQASSAYVGNRRIDWINVTKNKLNQDNLKKENPDTYKTYLETVTERVFKIH